MALHYAVNLQSLLTGCSERLLNLARLKTGDHFYPKRAANTPRFLFQNRTLLSLLISELHRDGSYMQIIKCHILAMTLAAHFADNNN